MKTNIIELGFIYALLNPTTQEIFYIGATQSAPKDRLKTHYIHFKEYLKGDRKSNKRYEYLENLFPILAEVKLLKIVQNDDLFRIEKEYIKQYSSKYSLTNQTDGGLGGDTFSLQETNIKNEISNLISIKNTGKTKPKGFSENLSKIREGGNNPAAKNYKDFKIEISKNNEILKICTAPYQITEFLNSIYGKDNHKIHAGRVGNIMKALRKKGSALSSGYTFNKL